MSRIGKQPVALPAGVEATIAGETVTIKGPTGQLGQTVHPRATVEIRDGESGRELSVTMKGLETTLDGALWGTTRANLQNMVEGVTKGYEKKLEMNGVGYKVALNGRTLKLDVGFSHPVEYPLPEGVSAAVEKNVITLNSIDKQLVGHTAAEIRKIRKPEPYKGKGIKYMEEIIRRKAGKAAKSA